MEDTETLVAIVSSLLPQGEGHFSQDAIVDALIQSDGDVDKTLQSLRSRSGASAVAESSRKRKHVDIQAWLKPSSKKREFKRADDLLLDSTTVQTHKKQTEKPPSSSKAEAPVDLMSVLRQPPSPRTAPFKLPPMILSTPDLVAKHTPCTMHLSVLPSELACRLFHTMVGRSKGWKRNKWWLFDRVVESPHLTSFFARETDGIDDDQTWQEAAQYW
jgi:hypothetical protein